MRYAGSVGVRFAFAVLAWSFAHQACAEEFVTAQAQSAATVPQYARFELAFTLAREYANPFDPDIVDVRVAFTEPDGAERIVPAFFSMDFDTIPGSPERYENGRNPTWKARFAPVKPGRHAYRIEVRDDSGAATVPGIQTFTCETSPAKGFLRIDPRDREMLRHETGQPYLPIGHNVGWAPNNTGLAWWKQHFDASAAVGVNWARIWMCAFGGPSLEWSSKCGPYWHGAGKLSLEIAQELDGMVELAEQRGISIQLVLQHHGQFSTKVNPNWADNPYNIANAADGGWLRAPEDFFTDAEARRLTRNRYRYIVARWGYSTAIHSWELWNEVQWTDGWNKNHDAVVQWHREMAQYLRDADPFDHLITTSSDFIGFKQLWSMPEIDLVQMHAYAESVLPAMEKAMKRLRAFGKPVLIAEYGLVAEGNIPEIAPDALPEPKRTQVLTGLHLHNGIWSAFHMKSGGHLWWWDSYIEARNLFPLYTPLSLYAKGEDVGANEMNPVAATVAAGAALENQPDCDALKAYALAGGSTALIWIHDTGSDYGGADHGTITGATLSLPMAVGEYAIEFWSTWDAGGVVGATTATSEGALTIPLPDFHRDIAVKIKFPAGATK